MKIDLIRLRELRLRLARPFETSFGITDERRVMLVELSAGGLTAWGECVAGEHPFFSDETIDTAWLITVRELAPRLLEANVERGSDVPNYFRAVRGHRMAKAALENAVWELQATREQVPLAQLLGGTRPVIACGVSIGIQPSLSEQLDTIERELAAGYQRIKLKCKPGWDETVFDAVRERWPKITLSCDANSAYRMHDLDRLVGWDRYNMLMVEQPLWHDDFYFHATLQRRMRTAICLDESIRNRRDALAAIERDSCRIINIKVGRVGGFSEAIAIHNVASERGIPVWCGGMLETGVGRAHNIALSSLPNFSLPGDVSASSRYWAEDVIEPPVTVNQQGEIRVPDDIGSGFSVVPERVKRFTVRETQLRPLAATSVFNAEAV